MFELRVRLAILTPVIAMMSSLAIAQDTDDVNESGEVWDPINDEELVLEEILVTGSRIPRDSFQSLQPTLVLDRMDFELRGNLNVAETLKEQPFFSPFGDSGIGGQGAGVGQNTLNILGIGSQRTLTLVNGQRFPASGLGSLSVDLNAIPSAIVERVETIAVGGAPIYGADAIAGTVNVILRDDFEGFEVMGSYGQSPEHNDNKSYQLALTWGTNFADGRGNLALTGQFDKTDGLKATDRPLSSTRWGFQVPADPNSPYDFVLFDDLIIAVDNLSPLPLFFGNQFFLNVFGNGIPLDINDPASPLSAFDDSGNLVPFAPGLATGSAIFRNGGDGLNLAEVSPLFTDIERSNANVFLNYYLTDSVRLHAEGWFANTQATEVTTQPFYNSNLFGGLPGNSYQHVGDGPIGILIDNPYISASARESIRAALDLVHDFDGDGQADPTIDTDGDGVPDAVGFWRTGAMTKLTGDRKWESNQDTLRAVIGLDGEFDWGGRSFLWDTYFTWGEVQSKDSSTVVLQSNFEQAVQVVVDANGKPACADPSGACVPLNVIGQPTPESLAYVTAWGIDTQTQDQTVFSGNITTDLFDLPAGPLAVAGGFAWRRESADYQPNQYSQSGLARFTRTAVRGEFDSAELYIETVIPLLGGKLDTPLVELLEFEGAFRYVDNSLAGADPTWTAGLRYQPIESLEFRGNYTRSIRAPSIVELFTPESQTGQFANDPCDSRYIDQGNYPDRRRANCAADGITQPFQSFVANASVEGTVSGNQNLNNERADSYTFGVIVRPSFAEGLVFSIDWLDINIDDAIFTLGLGPIMDACYDSADFANEPLCQQFTRDLEHQVNDFRVGYVNISNIKASVLQTVASYEIDLERFGDLRLNLNYQYIDEGTFTRGSDNPVEVAGEIGYNKDAVTAWAIWNTGKWTWYSQVRWLSSAVFSNADQEFTRDLKGVDAWYVFNGSVAYEFGENMSLQLNIDNLFDEGVPYGAMASGGSFTTYYPGIIGRMARITYRANF